jgi:hypothetical protein
MIVPIHEYRLGFDGGKVIQALLFWLIGTNDSVHHDSALVHDFLNFTARPLGRANRAGGIGGLPTIWWPATAPTTTAVGRGGTIYSARCSGPGGAAQQSTLIYPGKKMRPHHVTGTGRMFGGRPMPVARALCLGLHAIAVRKIDNHLPERDSVV